MSDIRYMKIDFNYKEVFFEVKSINGRPIIEDVYRSGNLTIKALYIAKIISDTKPLKVFINPNSSEIFKETLKEKLVFKNIKMSDSGRCKYL